MLTRPVASGGMAEVWEARLDGPVGFAKRVAIKRMMASLAQEPQFVGLFLDEARLMAGLTHPHICQVHELGEHEGSYWVAMEFLAGHTAYQLIRETVRRGWRLPLELAVLIARDVAEALAYAHAKRDEAGAGLGIIHRDVSPQNVMVTYEGVVKLVDFGIAKAATRTVVTESGQMRGKLAYMPPEQARGDEVDARADQFSLGATLFELATHTRLHGPLKDLDLFREVAGGEAPFPRARSRVPEIPDMLDDLIARMLERDPAKRFESMFAVRDALSTFLTDSPQSIPGTEALARYMAACFPLDTRPSFSASAGTPSSQRPGVRASPKRRRSPWVIGAGVALVVAVIGVGAWLSSGAPPPAPAKAEASPAQPPPAPTPEPMTIEKTSEPTPAREVDLTDEGLNPIAVVEPQQPKRPPRVAAAKQGFLSLQTTPWTNVFLGKRSLGETPLAHLPLPAGTHRLRLVNEEKKLSTTIEVEIKPEQTTIKRLKF